MLIYVEFDKKPSLITAETQHETILDRQHNQSACNHW
jgi:hypothetical protein